MPSPAIVCWLPSRRRGTRSTRRGPRPPARRRRPQSRSRASGRCDGPSIASVADVADVGQARAVSRWAGRREREASASAAVDGYGFSGAMRRVMVATAHVLLTRHRYRRRRHEDPHRRPSAPDKSSSRASPTPVESTGVSHRTAQIVGSLRDDTVAQSASARKSTIDQRDATRCSRFTSQSPNWRCVSVASITPGCRSRWTTMRTPPLWRNGPWVPAGRRT